MEIQEQPSPIIQAHAIPNIDKGVKDGVEEFVEFFESFLARNPKREIQIIRSIEDGCISVSK
jgi:predicted SnoaL-like aldol condensation-catalyzing enzyme